MYERFTDRARRVVVLAQEEARLLKHNYIGTEHILLGLLSEGHGVGCEALSGAGVSLDRLRLKIEAVTGHGAVEPVGHIPFTPRAKKVMELSLREALQLAHNYIGTEHLLLALIREGEGLGATALTDLGIELSDMRQRVISILAGHGKPSGTPDMRSQPVTVALDAVCDAIAKAPGMSVAEIGGQWLNIEVAGERFHVVVISRGAA